MGDLDNMVEPKTTHTGTIQPWLHIERKKILLLVDITGHDGLPLAIEFGLGHHHTVDRLSSYPFTPGFVPLLELTGAGDFVTIFRPGTA